jgi:hypothetical protein
MAWRLFGDGHTNGRAIMGWQMLVAFACGCLLGGATTIIVYSGDVLITRGVLDHLAKKHCADLQRIIERMVEARMAIELRTLARQLQQLAYNSTMRMDG